MPQAKAFDGQMIVAIDAKANPSLVAPDGTVSDEGERLRGTLDAYGARLVPQFGKDKQARLRALETDRMDLSRFYRLVGADGASAEAFAREHLKRDDLYELRDALLALEGVVEHAYFRPRPTPAAPVGGLVPPAATPDFSPQQSYLGAAPEGIDAYFAWNYGGPYGGGYGRDVHVIDVERDWFFGHEDLVNGTPVAATGSGDPGDRNHGTAVAGMLAGDVSTFGIVGICPAARFDAEAVGNEDLTSASAIFSAAERMAAGDIMLLELHNPGPVTLFNDVDFNLQQGFIAVEYYPEDFAAIRYATSRGILVVSAAGNGGVSLEDQHTVMMRGRGPTWPDPFARGDNDSGSILVGAGAAPGGVLPDRARKDFSNWGNCVDVQGWGDRVVTTGGLNAGPGDLQGGTAENRWYTSTFSGTSSAAAMVAGALACLQGIVRAQGRAPLTPARARELLRTFGSPQQARDGEDLAARRIGPRPDLRRLIPAALGAPADTGGMTPTPYGCGCGPSIAIYVGGGCGPGGSGGGGGPHWGGPHWGGPHWGGPHWGGPHWGGPHWGGPRAPGS